MWLIFVFALVDFGSSYTTEKCYGSSYEFPFRFTPPLFKGSIYYRPRGEERKLVVSDGQPIDKRFLLIYGKIRMKDLTEQDDEGVLHFGRVDTVKLRIDDCQDLQSNYYGFLFSWKIPNGAEYLEFSQMTSSGFAQKPQVIWNNTDASISWGTVTNRHFEIYNLKQRHSGYYKFRGANGELIKWTRLEVQEFSRYFDQMVGDSLKLDFSVKMSKLPHILFTPQGSDDEHTIEREYMYYRMDLTESYFSFRDLQYDDSGTYKFVDDEGFLAVRMKLDVNAAPLPVWVYIVVAVVIILCITCCCCCVKKCCCKKSSNKRNSPETETAAPPVFYHDTTQPAQPLVPLLTREPRAKDPPMYNAPAGNMSPPTSTQVTLPEELGPTSTSMISTSSDSEPKFEFKGMVFPSAPPLSSDTSIQDVYTSDKLNFL